MCTQPKATLATIAPCTASQTWDIAGALGQGLVFGLLTEALKSVLGNKQYNGGEESHWKSGWLDTDF